MQEPEVRPPAIGRRLVLVIGLAVLVADLITKQIMLGWIFDPPRRVEILPVLNFAPVWNPGISFGMLALSKSSNELLIAAN